MANVKTEIKELPTNEWGIGILENYSYQVESDPEKNGMYLDFFYKDFYYHGRIVETSDECYAEKEYKDNNLKIIIANGTAQAIEDNIIKYVEEEIDTDFWNKNLLSISYNFLNIENLNKIHRNISKADSIFTLKLSNLMGLEKSLEQLDRAKDWMEEDKIKHPIVEKLELITLRMSYYNKIIEIQDVYKKLEK